MNEMSFPSNFRHAQYGATGIAVDDPQKKLEDTAYNTRVVIPSSSINAAAANTVAIQAALDLGGLVQVAPDLGDIYVRQAGSSGVALTVRRNTRFIVGPGTRLRLAPNSNCNIIRNENFASARNVITQLTTPDAGITAVAQSAVLPEVGKYVIILGATPRIYNNAYKVLSSGGGQFTVDMSTRVAPAETPATPATGSIIWMQADENIAIEGEFDYDESNQTTPDTWLKHAIYLRRLVNFSFDGVVTNATKYALALGNVYQSSVRRAYFDTVSDGIHVIGSWDDLHIGTVQGKTGDDMVAAGNSDYPQYLDPAHAVGDGGALKVDTIIADGSFTAFKYFGCSTNTCKSIQIGSIQGRISGGSAFVNIINDPGATSGTSSSIERLEIGSITPVEPVSTAVLQFSGAITVTSARVGNIDSAVNNSANARPVLIGAGPTISFLEIDRLSVQAASYSSSSFGVHITGTVTDLIVNDFYCRNIGICHFMAGSSGACNMRVNNFVTINCGQAYRNVSGTSQVLTVGSISRIGYQSSPHIDHSNTAAGSTTTVMSAFGMNGTDAFGGSGNNKTIVWAPHVGIDVGGVGVVRQAGAMVLFRGARGTLVDNNLVVCDATGAAGSWKQVSNTANNF